MSATNSLHQKIPTLDLSTLTCYDAGNGTLIAALRSKLDVKLFNPVRGLRIKSLMKVARNDSKKASKAKLPWTIKEYNRMVHSGMHMHTGARQAPRRCTGFTPR